MCPHHRVARRSIIINIKKRRKKKNRKGKKDGFPVKQSLMAPFVFMEQMTAILQLPLRHYISWAPVSLLFGALRAIAVLDFSQSI